ncbi:hypothetical protein NDU88_003129 [Pleurodeles waltl]|uniref:Uncharacterized protein n=1 Tax=Pleurodeles waltl TaxID=8319 RepID=A0AAV7P966_PLEWA|nr:hypothetical protein NDU88_003129 [Pleurodeles waltl]
MDAQQANANADTHPGRSPRDPAVLPACWRQPGRTRSSSLKAGRTAAVQSLLPPLPPTPQFSVPGGIMWSEEVRRQRRNKWEEQKGRQAWRAPGSSAAPGNSAAYSIPPCLAERIQVKTEEEGKQEAGPKDPVPHSHTSLTSLGVAAVSSCRQVRTSVLHRSGPARASQDHRTSQARAGERSLAAENTLVDPMQPQLLQLRSYSRDLQQEQTASVGVGPRPSVTVVGGCRQERPRSPRKQPSWAYVRLAGTGWAALNKSLTDLTNATIFNTDKLNIQIQILQSLATTTMATDNNLDRLNSLIKRADAQVEADKELPTQGHHCHYSPILNKLQELPSIMSTIVVNLKQEAEEWRNGSQWTHDQPTPGTVNRPQMGVTNMATQPEACPEQTMGAITESPEKKNTHTRDEGPFLPVLSRKNKKQLREMHNKPSRGQETKAHPAHRKWCNNPLGGIWGKELNIKEELIKYPPPTKSSDNNALPPGPQDGYYPQRQQIEEGTVSVGSMNQGSLCNAAAPDRPSEPQSNCPQLYTLLQSVSSGSSLKISPITPWIASERNPGPSTSQGALPALTNPTEPHRSHVQIDKYAISTQATHPSAVREMTREQWNVPSPIDAPSSLLRSSRSTSKTIVRSPNSTCIEQAPTDAERMRITHVEITSALHTAKLHTTAPNPLQNSKDKGTHTLIFHPP